jgi:hypothetical protein
MFVDFIQAPHVIVKQRESRSVVLFGKHFLDCAQLLKDERRERHKRASYPRRFQKLRMRNSAGEGGIYH